MNIRSELIQCLYEEAPCSTEGEASLKNLEFDYPVKAWKTLGAL